MALKVLTPIGRRKNYSTVKRKKIGMYNQEFVNATSHNELLNLEFEYHFYYSSVFQVEVKNNNNFPVKVELMSFYAKIWDNEQQTAYHTRKTSDWQSETSSTRTYIHSPVAANQTSNYTVFRFDATGEIDQLYVCLKFTNSNDSSEYTYWSYPAMSTAGGSWPYSLLL